MPWLHAECRKDNDVILAVLALATVFPQGNTAKANRGWRQNGLTLRHSTLRPGQHFGSYGGDSRATLKTQENTIEIYSIPGIHWITWLFAPIGFRAVFLSRDGIPAGCRCRARQNDLRR